MVRENVFIVCLSGCLEKNNKVDYILSSFLHVLNESGAF